MSEICKFLTNAVTCIVSGTEIRIIGFVVLLLDLQNIDNFITVRPFSIHKTKLYDLQSELGTYNVQQNYDYICSV